MSVPKRSKRAKLSSYILLFGNSFSITPRDELFFCQLWHVIINSDKKFNIISHVSSQKHQEKPSKKKPRPIQSFLNEKKRPYIEIITEAFLSANNLVHKLRHPAIKQLFTKLDLPIPKETMCRNVVDILYGGKEMKSKQNLKTIAFL
ncbi:hypothetical protein CDIK_1546 [Cucumispora dikerogammari]|nr:hypothetical protein CDIK_1546 [Cucumispora dikerogammari]